ncbi:MAG: DNA alkylation repair protein [Aestuariivita sp.]|nr:DNA alkylation repair protein [Aestuariivita sp.]
MLIKTFLDELKKAADPERAIQMAKYHKVKRTYLGLSNGQLNDFAKVWRKDLTVTDRVILADQLWKTDIYEARLAAAKLLTQARINPDHKVWKMICSWASSFDSWAIADHACMAGHKRIIADPARIDDIADWALSEHMWMRRAALVITLPWAREKQLSSVDIARRERILDWAESYVEDHEWFIQKAIAWWLRDLSKRDPKRVATFLQSNASRMKPFARKEASKYLD